jgi:hypothetical protein
MQIYFAFVAANEASIRHDDQWYIGLMPRCLTADKLGGVCLAFSDFPMKKATQTNQTGVLCCGLCQSHGRK